MLVDNLMFEMLSPKDLPCNELDNEQWVLEVRGRRGAGSESSDLANASEIEAWDLSLLNLDGAGSREGKGGESDDHGRLHADDV